MPSEEARMAKALEAIAHHNGEMTKAFRALNENLVGMAKILEKMIPVETETMWVDGKSFDVVNPNQLTIDQMRAAEEAKHKCPDCKQLNCLCGITEGRIY